MPAKGIMKVHQNVLFDKIVANVTNITAHMPKHKVLCASRDCIVNIIDPGRSSKNVPIRYTQYRPPRSHHFKWKNTSNPQTLPRIGRMLSTYLQITVLSVQNLSTWSKNSRRCEMVTMNKSVQLRIYLARDALEKHKKDLEPSGKDEHLSLYSVKISLYHLQDSLCQSRTVSTPYTQMCVTNN